LVELTQVRRRGRICQSRRRQPPANAVRWSWAASAPPPPGSRI